VVAFDGGKPKKLSGCSLCLFLLFTASQRLPTTVTVIAVCTIEGAGAAALELFSSALAAPDLDVVRASCRLARPLWVMNSEHDQEKREKQHKPLPFWLLDTYENVGPAAAFAEQLATSRRTPLRD
jgi:hypothetical protein